MTYSKYLLVRNTDMMKYKQLREMLSEAIREIRINGILSLVDRFLQFLFFGAYLKVRSYFPPNISKLQVRNGIKVKADDAKLLDAIVGFPYYEKNEIKFIRKHVTPGDTVVDIGGGMGVTAVWGAQKAGSSGTVHVYEASKSCVNQIETTLTLNAVPATVTVNHAMVAEKVGEVRFEEGNRASIVTPDELPECDVLNMDCEGAELPILKNMSITPRVVLVETHAQFGSPQDTIIDILEQKGYKIVDVLGGREGMSQVAAVAQETAT